MSEPGTPTSPDPESPGRGLVEDDEPGGRPDGPDPDPIPEPNEPG